MTWALAGREPALAARRSAGGICPPVSIAHLRSSVPRPPTPTTPMLMRSLAPSTRPCTEKRMGCAAALLDKRALLPVSTAAPAPACLRKSLLDVLVIRCAAETGNWKGDLRRSFRLSEMVLLGCCFTH